MTKSIEDISDLRRALTHLHDPAYLENHPLALQISSTTQVSELSLSRGQLLSQVLRLSIEALDPGKDVAPTDSEARPYHILRNRYISRQGIPIIASQLGIGERQAYRELKRGMRALLNILNEYKGEKDGSSSSPAHRVRSEIDRISEVSHQIVDIRQLVEQVIQSVTPMAKDWDVKIQWIPETEGRYVKLNRVLLRQVLFNLFSHTIRRSQGVDPIVRFGCVENEVYLKIIYQSLAPLDLHEAARPYAVASELLDSLGVVWERQNDSEKETVISIKIPLAERKQVLIVDDNAGLIRLFKRYLSDQPYLINSTTNATQALELIAELQPEIIILDVMMPKRDGWDVLQEIRQYERGKRAKVLICSIINDPDLVTAMGADGFLHKPVNRANLLQALEDLSSPVV